jgi:hypothetical protein
LGLFSLPNPSFKGNRDFNKSGNEMLKNQYLNSQDSKLIIVAVQVGAVKIYAATTLEELKRPGKTE